MALPRSRYVQEGQEGVFHCFSRCVRRAFLYGFDALTRRDFSHRKARNHVLYGVSRAGTTFNLGVIRPVRI